jgi:branched-chain amino acid transport system substrate-binding protein
MGKALAERGLTPPAVKILAQGELTHPEALESMGDTAKGIITSYHFVMESSEPANAEFVKAYRDANTGRSPDLFSYGGYDGMHLIYEALKKTNGDAGGDALVAAAKGMSWQSPRGPVSIDPETRDIVQNVYIREVKEVDGKLQNVLIDTIPNVKDPLHGAAK